MTDCDQSELSVTVVHDHDGECSVTVMLKSGASKNMESVLTFQQFVGMLELTLAIFLPEKGTRPDDIPGKPPEIYKDAGWIGYGDWVGTGTQAASGVWRPFEEARKFVHALGLKSHAEWRQYVAGKFPDLPPRPRDIPAAPFMLPAYKEAGWAGYPDWLEDNPRMGSLLPGAVSTQGNATTGYTQEPGSVLSGQGLERLQGLVGVGVKVADGAGGADGIQISSKSVQCPI